MMLPWLHNERKGRKKIESYYYRVYIKTIISRKALLKRRHTYTKKKMIMIWAECGSVHYKKSVIAFIFGSLTQFLS